MPEYHTEGATSLSAGTWSGSGIAAGGDFTIRKNAAHIVDDLDFSTTSQVSTFLLARAVTGGIGTASSPLKLGVSTEFHDDSGGGVIYYEAQASDTNACALYVKTGFGKTVFQGAGAITQIDQANGETEFGASVDAPTTEQAGGTSSYDASSDKHDSIKLLGGSMVTRRSIEDNSSVVIRGGKLTQSNPAATTGSTTTIDVYDGELDWRGAISTGTTVNVYGGGVDFSKVSTATSGLTVNVYPTARGNKLLDTLEQLNNATINYKLGAVTGSVSGGHSTGTPV